jgi:hypothetical protein
MLFHSRRRTTDAAMTSRLNWIYAGTAALCLALAACQPDDVAEMVTAAPDIAEIADIDFGAVLVADAGSPSPIQPESF